MEIKSKKFLGAYYTHPFAVDFLVGWATRSGASSIMDPSCGDRRFLWAAQDAGVAWVIGIDLDPGSVERCRAALQPADDTLLLEADFFSIEPSRFGGLYAIVGNPPFVRYQRFSAESRRLALESALRFGVRLTRLTSTWAPFLLHAAQFLRPGGRLAMVVPAEIGQTQYGLPTLRALVGRFASVSLISFEQNIFKDAQADTYLLLAEGYGGRADGVQLLPLRGLADLAEMSPEDNRGLALPIEEDFRFVEAFLSPAERRAWTGAKAAEHIFALGDLGTITNGYVTGDNEFFHRIRSKAVAGGALQSGYFQSRAMGVASEDLISSPGLLARVFRKTFRIQSETSRMRPWCRSAFGRGSDFEKIPDSARRCAELCDFPCRMGQSRWRRSSCRSSPRVLRTSPPCSLSANRMGA